MTLSFWFALPLVASVSLVYAATRHEDVGDIMRHALRSGLLDRGIYGACVRGAVRHLEAGLVGSLHH